MRERHRENRFVREIYPFGLREEAALCGSYVVHRLGKDRRGFRVGLSAVFLVVCFCALLQEVVHKSAVIFLKAAENDVGETDILYLPIATTILPPKLPQRRGSRSPPPSAERSENSDGASAGVESLPLPGIVPSVALLNSTLYSSQTQELRQFVRGAVPRWALKTTLSQASDPTTPKWVTMTANTGGEAVQTTAVMVVGDTAMEQAATFGRSFAERALTNDEECYISGSIARALSIAPGDGKYISAEIDLASLLPQSAKEEMAAEGTPLGESRNSSRDGAQPQNNRTDDDLIVLFTALRMLGLDLEEPLSVSFDRSRRWEAVNSGLNETLPLPSSRLQLMTLQEVISLILARASPSDRRRFSQLELKLHPIHASDSPDGKWPAAFGNVIFIDARFCLIAIIRSIKAKVEFISERSVSPLVPLALTIDIDPMVAAARNVRLGDYAMSSNLILQERIHLYMKEVAAQKNTLTAESDRIAIAVGVTTATSASTPLQKILSATEFIRLFLDNLLVTVVVILVLLSAVLVYALTLSDVENNTYEFGMLRALGMRKKTVVGMLLVQSALYSTPGLSLGLLLAFLLSMPVTYLLAAYSSGVFTYVLHWSAIALGVSLGIALPAIANILPIRRALARTLRDSLDVYHVVLNELQITMLRLHTVGLSTSQTVAALLLIGFGFATYYMIPLSFALRSFSLFFLILNVVLLAFMLGLVFVGQILQPALQQAFAWSIVKICSLMRDRHLFRLVQKNLQQHRHRNRLTAVMFTTALTFLIFAGSIFTLQGHSLAASIQQQWGSDIIVTASQWADPLDEEKLRVLLDKHVACGRSSACGANGAAMDKEKRRPTAIIEAYCFSTFALDESASVFDFRVSNDALSPGSSASLRGLPSNMYDCIYDDYVAVAEIADGLSAHDIRNASRLLETLGEHYSDADPPIDPTVILPDGRKALLRDSLGVLSGFNVNSRTAGEEVREKESNITRQAGLADVIVQPLPILLAEGVRDGWSVKAGQQITLRVKVEELGGLSLYYKATVRGMVRKLPGLRFSSYPAIQGQSDACTSTSHLQRIWEDALRLQRWKDQADRALAASEADVAISGSPQAVSSNVDANVTQSNANSSSNDGRAGDAAGRGEGPMEGGGSQGGLAIRKSKLLIRVSNRASATDRNFLTNSIRSLTSDSHTIVDTQTLVESTYEAADLLQIMFALCGGIAFILAFFLLWTSTTANVRENLWAMGVLRATGLSVPQTIRVWIYEGLALVCASIFLGALIGTTTACTLTLQFNLFSELPFALLLPYGLFGLMSLLGISTAVLGAALPTWAAARRPIAQILRGSAS